MKELFCEYCGKILNIENVENKIIAKCSCGYLKELENSPTYSEKIKEKIILGKGIFNEEKDSESGFQHICPKCKHDKCEVASKGASYGDESDLIFYRCKKCNYVDRQADGSSNG